jgi:hypothetical protein
MKWPGLRDLFRFNLSTLLCMVLATNLVIYMNFLTKQPYFAYVYEGPSQRVRSGENYTRVTHYQVGWPVRFLSIEKQKIGMSPTQKPVFERTYTLISWQSAASTAAASLALIAIYSWVLARLFRLVMPVSNTKRPMKKHKADISAASELSKPG